MFISSAFLEDRSIKLNNQIDSVKSKSESNLLETTLEKRKCMRFVISLMKKVELFYLRFRGNFER